MTKSNWLEDYARIYLKVDNSLKPFISLRHLETNKRGDDALSKSSLNFQRVDTWHDRIFLSMLDTQETRQIGCRRQYSLKKQL